jgi:hypothetical protein
METNLVREYKILYRMEGFPKGTWANCEQIVRAYTAEDALTQFKLYQSYSGGGYAWWIGPNENTEKENQSAPTSQGA